MNVGHGLNHLAVMYFLIFYLYKSLVNAFEKKEWFKSAYPYVDIYFPSLIGLLLPWKREVV